MLTVEGIILETCQEISSYMIRNALPEFTNRIIKCIERESGYVEALMELMKNEFLVISSINIMLVIQRSICMYIFAYLQNKCGCV